MSVFWKIEEAVGGGLYMALDGIFETREAAEAAIAKHRSHDGMRAMPYETSPSWYDGARRIEGYRS